jgi:hypothetical protein
MGFLKKLFGGTKTAQPNKVSKPNIETIQDPRILLCSIRRDSQDADLLMEDRLIYQDCYKNLVEYRAKGISDFLAFLQDKSFDIAHLFIDVDADGTLEGQSIPQVMRYLEQRDVKLILFADTGPARNPTKGFHADNTKGIRVNFVVTIDRRGERFRTFFKKLFTLMANGESLFMAWVKIAPQAEGPWMDDLPSTYVAVGRGELKFIP